MLITSLHQRGSSLHRHIARQSAIIPMISSTYSHRHILRPYPPPCNLRHQCLLLTPSPMLISCFEHHFVLRHQPLLIHHQCCYSRFRSCHRCQYLSLSLILESSREFTPSCSFRPCVAHLSSTINRSELYHRPSTRHLHLSMHDVFTCDRRTMPACRHRNVIPSAALIISYLVAPTLRIAFVILAISTYLTNADHLPPPTRLLTSPSHRLHLSTSIDALRRPLLVLRQC
jgi:hypothetical protein